MWVARLPQILPESERFVYVLFEDTKNYQPKYWVYEMCIPELICILGEVCGLDDFYIVSKKFEWLISECHEDIVSFVGNSLNLSCFDESQKQTMDDYWANDGSAPQSRLPDIERTTLLSPLPWKPKKPVSRIPDYHAVFKNEKSGVYGNE